MLTRATLRRQDGSALITALMVILVMLPIGMALLAIVDTQARNSNEERTRDRAFNLADSALTSAAFNLGRYSWPSTGTASPNNLGSTGTAGPCGTSSYGATLGAATNPGSATAKLQPNLNASYDDSSYTGARWQINVCDDDPGSPGPTVWKDALLTRTDSNYDANGNQLVWVRSEAEVGGRTRVLAALVNVKTTPALSSKYGLMAGRMNSELTNFAGNLLTSGQLGNLVGGLLGTDPLVAADPSLTPTTPASTGVTAVRCGALEGCLTGALAATGSVALVNTLVTGGKIVQATSPTATSTASIEQLKQQAINAGTYVASTTGTASTSNPPACSIPAAANANTVVYIEQVGTGDEYCTIDVSSGKAYKALVIGSGRVVLRGNNTRTAISNATSGSPNTFRGLVYALNLQRSSLGDSATAAREVIRIDRGAHVRGGVAADGKSGQVGTHPPAVCGVVLIVDTCVLLDTLELLGLVTAYNPAIQSDVSLMNAVSVYDATSIVSGTYRDIAGEVG